MFQEKFVDLLAIKGNAGFHLPLTPIPPEDAARPYISEATPPLSERLRAPQRWRTLRARRRAHLTRLNEDAANASAADLNDAVAALLEEPRWSEEGDGQLFDDPSMPAIDRFAAETGMLLAWTALTFQDALDAHALAAMRYEARRRLLTPVMAQDGYPFLKGDGADALVILCDLLTLAALMETDAARFARVARPLLKGMDLFCDRPARLIPLREVTDGLTALTVMADALGLEAALPLEEGLDELLCAWVRGDRFIDPAGSGWERGLSGIDLFRLGQAAGDMAVCRLGAYLHRARPLGPSNVLGRMTAGRLIADMEALTADPPRLRAGASRDQMRMLVRTRDFLCAMNGQAGHGNAGDVALFSGDEAIFSGGDGAYSVPAIEGIGQRIGECPCSFETKGDRDTMSIDLTQAYPDACEVRAFQRTLIASRQERSIRWVDALSTRTPKEIVFRFVCGVKPSVFATAVRFGALRMTWEGEMEIKTHPMPDGRTLLTFRPTEAVSRGLYAFTLDWGGPG